MSTNIRETKEFWAIDGAEVKKVQGFSCKPEHPETWFVPSLGLSMTEGYHLFNSEIEAVKRAMFKQSDVIAEAKEMLRRLTERYEKLK